MVALVPLLLDRQVINEYGIPYIYQASTEKPNHHIKPLEEGWTYDMHGFYTMWLK